MSEGKQSYSSLSNRILITPKLAISVAIYFSKILLILLQIRSIIKRVEENQGVTIEKFNFENNIGKENKLPQIEIYKLTNFCKLQNCTSVNIFLKDIFEPIVN